MCFDNLVDALVICKIHTDKKLRVWQREMSEATCIVLDLFELFWMHQDDELRLRLHPFDVLTHT